MKLISFTVSGYRRFTGPTSVRISGDLIAFVGPNGAGKSSLLEALKELGSDQPIGAKQRTRRRTDLEPTLKWQFALDEADLDVVADVPDTGHLKRVTLTKRGDSGRRRWEFHPRRPERDRSHRAELSALLNAMRADEFIRELCADDDTEFNAQYDAVIDLLTSDQETYAPDQIGAVRDLADRLNEAEFEADPNLSDESNQLSDAAWRDVQSKVVLAVSRAADVESEATPAHQAIERLDPRVPEVIEFGQADRELDAHYDLIDVADNPPPALQHLAKVADLNLPHLRDLSVTGDTSTRSTLRNHANARLAELFDQSWNQQGIAIQIEFDGTVMHIQATTPHDSGLGDFADESDGMRWFAALLAFTHGWTNKPILLVDEIERHLHYDAQADLIDVLAHQKYLSKVIYTTHSFGCLPHDLGVGVRVVRQLDDGRSEFSNSFWSGGAGFSTALASMGAAIASFTPSRYALIVEGEADATLLPTLFREVSAAESLEFQVAPGLAIVATSAAAGLDAEAGRVAFLVDGDPGGTAIKAKLTAAGIADDRIVRLIVPGTDEPLELEDLIETDLYLRALNKELQQWNPGAPTLTAADIGTSLRTKEVARWCEEHRFAPPSKINIAERVLDMAVDDQAVLAPDRRGALLATLAKVHELLNLALLEPPQLE